MHTYIKSVSIRENKNKKKNKKYFKTYGCLGTQKTPRIKFKII